MRTKTVVIGSINSSTVKNIIQKKLGDVDNILPLRKMDTWVGNDFSNFHVIIATNPYLSGFEKEKEIFEVLSSQGVKHLTLISTMIYGESGDYYQYLKRKQELLFQSIEPYQVIRIGFERKVDPSVGKSSIHYFHADGSVNYVTLTKIQQFIFFRCRIIFWKGFVKNKFLNMAFKAAERLIFKAFAIKIPSSCYFGVSK